jgi:hypothetical protein
MSFELAVLAGPPIIGIERFLLFIKFGLAWYAEAYTRQSEPTDNSNFLTAVFAVRKAFASGQISADTRYLILQGNRNLILFRSIFCPTNSHSFSIYAN